WPLPQEKLSQLRLLIQHEVEKGHLVPTTSPWSCPVFVIQKKSDAWRLLHDLRAVNAVLEDMGPLQPGLPWPSMLPQDWPVVVTDIKDCFFSIPLHPDDQPRFAMTIPTINNQEPVQRYHWTVFPQGMKNSPTLCQWFVSRALRQFQDTHQNWVLYHYMDDILLCGEGDINTTLKHLIQVLKEHGLEIAPEKVQKTAPVKYLGTLIQRRAVQPQKLQIEHQASTLHALQVLVGNLQWLRQFIPITHTNYNP
ncbi:hypothetical protein N329_03452, partial [Haliaeetus albicilla]